MDSSITRLSDIYSRQTNIGSYTNKSAMVIGVGGVGSWIALDLALLGFGTLVLVDNDNLESSNLNRTLYKLEQTGKKKTEAVMTLIHERRPDSIVITIEDHFQTVLLDKYKVDYIFDCTDNLASRQLIRDYFKQSESKLSIQIPYCKCGYDGFQATLSFNDFNSGRWGDDGSYTAVPSFFGTPQLLSAIAVVELIMVDSVQSGSTNFNIKKILTKIKENP